ncbi:MAG: ATP-binding cassette domain-containing protein [Spirochaetaceae bacterium]|jgi:putative multiple sugar transport system ATP-binding protein|uniref:ATP-binding cassette domain-containing protein n=1 Tax=Sphaerochaeta halotolerans TaxID=2293840 RepID=A0A372MFC6_9SPIR|nr:ATP-binding cassette domain-containing protein [Sphaerochaeta halotolerans]MBG0768096.1 ATP-binding cassette domain-containing protein [Spirochaetaceae bacterium]MDN5334433.1 putative multiple sugar transport system ATP-binding protein [Sphaerochaeta sp.]RFU94487.1 ATP-binding cassette domain-containing protein [Sphaerochaeta halotolerans]
MPNNSILLSMKHITKVFPGVKALDDVSLDVKTHEIHALVGENGAGKSTLMKVLSGVYPHGTYEGDILFEGKHCTFSSIRQSEQAGIVIIHQELALSPYLSIAENMFIGDERAKFNIINWDKTREDALKYMERIGLHENPNIPVNKLGVGKQQMVEIAKALAKHAKLLILDEPTSALNERDSQHLLDILKELRDKDNISSVLISHKLNEVAAVADSITILRDGKTIETLDVERKKDTPVSISEERIIKGMVGREITDMFPKRDNPIGDVLFEIKDWTVQNPDNPERKKLDGVNIQVRVGEVVGLAGLVGAGRTELAMSVFGHAYGENITGRTLLEGKDVDISTIPKAIAHGVAYVPEDRKEFGLILIQNIKENTTLAKLKKISKASVINEHEENIVAEEFCKRLNTKTPTILQQTGNLSGGNQQKVVLSKWLFTDPRVLILDEPTRGIDVGTKHEIYTIINSLAAQGLACILISSEMPEIIGMSDRIYVMSEGKITAELSGETATQEEIMRNILNN